MVVPPKSSILMGCSIIYQPSSFWGTPIYGNLHINWALVECHEAKALPGQASHRVCRRWSHRLFQEQGPGPIGSMFYHSREKLGLSGIIPWIIPKLKTSAKYLMRIPGSSSIQLWVANSPDILGRNGRNGNMWQLEGSHPNFFCRKNNGWSSSKVLDMLLVLESTGGQKGNPAHTQQYLGLVKAKMMDPFYQLCPVADGVIQRHHQQEMLGLSRDCCHSEERLVAIQASQSVLQHRCCSLHMFHHIKKACSGMNGHSWFTFLGISSGTSQNPQWGPFHFLMGKQIDQKKNLESSIHKVIFCQCFRNCQEGTSSHAQLSGCCVFANRWLHENKCNSILWFQDVSARTSTKLTSDTSKADENWWHCTILQYSTSQVLFILNYTGYSYLGRGGRGVAVKWRSKPFRSRPLSHGFAATISRTSELDSKYWDVPPIPSGEPTKSYGKWPSRNSGYFPS